MDAIVEVLIGDMHADPDVLDEPVAGWQDSLQHLAHDVRRVALAQPLEGHAARRRAAHLGPAGRGRIAAPAPAHRRRQGKDSPVAPVCPLHHIGVGGHHLRMDPTIRVSVVAEGDVVSKGLVSVVGELSDAVLVPGPVEDWGREAHVDVVLYDVIALHHGAGDDLVHLVKETDAAVVAVARELRPDLADQALEKGVDGLIPLSATTREIQEVIRAAASGGLMGDGTFDSLDYTRTPTTPPGRECCPAGRPT